MYYEQNKSGVIHVILIIADYECCAIVVHTPLTAHDIIINYKFSEHIVFVPTLVYLLHIWIIKKPMPGNKLLIITVCTAV